VDSDGMRLQRILIDKAIFEWTSKPTAKGLDAIIAQFKEYQNLWVDEALTLALLYRVEQEVQGELEAGQG
jgi:hypothetical protein